MSEKQANYGYTAYRIAGEMFGRLKSDVGFGELTMSANESVVLYTWRFHAQPSASLPKQFYACQISVYLSALLSLCSIEAEAERIADMWKNEHRRVTE